MRSASQQQAQLGKAGGSNCFYSPAARALLQMRPYQLQSLKFMLDCERGEGGFRRFFYLPVRVGLLRLRCLLVVQLRCRSSGFPLVAAL